MTKVSKRLSVCLMTVAVLLLFTVMPIQKGKDVTQPKMEPVFLGSMSVDIPTEEMILDSLDEGIIPASERGASSSTRVEVQWYALNYIYIYKGQSGVNYENIKNDLDNAEVVLDIETRIVINMQNLYWIKGLNYSEESSTGAISRAQYESNKKDGIAKVYGGFPTSDIYYDNEFYYDTSNYNVSNGNSTVFTSMNNKDTYREFSIFTRYKNYYKATNGFDAKANLSYKGMIFSYSHETKGSIWFGMQDGNVVQKNKPN